MDTQNDDPGGGQVENKPRKGGGAPRHDKNSGTVRYSDGNYRIDISINGERMRRKVGVRAGAPAARRSEIGSPARRSRVYAQGRHSYPQA